jgi:hypothetical protein
MSTHDFTGGEKQSHSAVDLNGPIPLDAEKNYSNDDDSLDHPIAADRLARKLSARQVQMIAIGGTIGTGLFLGTGKSLATAGPASMLIAYLIVGAIVFITMLSLGMHIHLYRREINVARRNGDIYANRRLFLHLCRVGFYKACFRLTILADLWTMLSLSL